jgi:peptidoglycan/xylan/chitin deacetylase (PgdA/CDA1 family)
MQKGNMWPQGAPFAVCPTHDVDRIRKYGYHYLYKGFSGGPARFLRQLLSLKERLLGEEPFWNFEKIMKMEDKLGVRSTFLFLNESARGGSPKFWGRYDINDPKVKRMIQLLVSGGWEIGLHGSFFSYRNLSLLMKEKQILQDIAGKPIRSCRQHYLNIALGKTWHLQREAGLEVDSTIGFADRIWNDRQGILPFYPDDSQILELPITVMDTVGLESAQVRMSVEELVKRVSLAGGLIVLDWHQCWFNPIEHPERVEVYSSILSDAKSKGAWIATMGEIADHWNQRCVVDREA